MTPGLTYLTTGRVDTSSARIIHAMQNKLIQYESNSFADKNLHQPVITAVQWGYSDSRSPLDKPKRRSLL